MKTMKVALLATAALAAISVSARADETAAIKAQLEALTARIAQLEATPSVPAGYSLLTISEGTPTVVPGLEVLRKDAAGYGDTATIIGIMPTADMPASTTIEWSGYARAAIVYHDFDLDGDSEDDGDYDGIDVVGRGQLKVVGKTDTAVGEVGAQLEIRGNIEGRRESFDTTGLFGQFENVLYFETFWGWWAMTPELTLGGGFAGSLGNIGYGYDGACSCYYTDNADVYANPGDTTQMRLSWASGPLSAAIALEDASGRGGSWGDGHTSGTGDFDDDLGVAAEVKYTGDTISGEIAGTWRGGPDIATVPYLGGPGPTTDGQDFWQVGAGIGFSLGEMASLSIAANVGETTYNAEFWTVNALLSANLGETVRGELGAGYKEYDNDTFPDRTVWGVLAGLYYDPVPQLTIGLEAEYHVTEQDNVVATDDDLEGTGTSVDLVTIFRF